MLNIESVELLLLVAAVVAMVARRLRLPYSVGLVLGGIVLAWMPFVPDIALTRELIFNAFLPPLIFEAAIYIAWPSLRNDLPVVLTLATVGVVLSAGITTAGMHVPGPLELAGRTAVRRAHLGHRSGVGDRHLQGGGRAWPVAGAGRGGEPPQ